MKGPLPEGNRCAMLEPFARAMNPRVVGLGPVLFAQPNVRGVPLGKKDYLGQLALI